MIEIDNIKKLLRYQKHDIDASKILDQTKTTKPTYSSNNSSKKSPKGGIKPSYRFEIQRFKAFGWKFQMISVVASDCDILGVNKRATELLYLDSNIPRSSFYNKI
jgi:hypothetical protein